MPIQIINSDLRTQEGGVSAAMLAADAVTSAKLADDAVGSEHIQALAVGSAELAADAVTDQKLDRYGARQGTLSHVNAVIDSWQSQSALATSVEIVSAALAHIRRPMGGIDHHLISLVKTDAALPWTVRAESVVQAAKWLHLSHFETTPTGTWSPVVSSTYVGGLIIQCATNSGTQTLSRDVTGKGQLWLRFTKRPSAGYTYVSVKDANGVERCCLPLSGANRYYDGYGATDLQDDAILVASGLEQGTYTVLLTKSHTEKHASSTDYRSLPVALAFVDADEPSVGSVEQKRVTVHPRHVVTEVSSVLANRHNASSIATSGDITAQVFASGDFIYVGMTAAAGQEAVDLRIQIGTGNSNSVTLSAALWNGSTWAAATITDGTNGLAQSGTIRLTTPPAAMTSATVNGLAGYWVRIGFSGTTTAVTISGISITVRAASADITKQVIELGNTEKGSAVDIQYNSVWADFGGQAHGGEIVTAGGIYVDGQLIDGTAGYARGSAIVIRESGNLVHPEATIGTFLRQTRFTKRGISYSNVYTFTQSVAVGSGSGAGTIGASYPFMWAGQLSNSGSWVMRKGAVLAGPTVKYDLTTAAAARTLFGSGTLGVGWAWWDDNSEYALVAYSNQMDNMLAGGTGGNVFLDANRAGASNLPTTTADAKGYARMTERSFVSGESFSMGGFATVVRARNFGEILLS